MSGMPCRCEVRHIMRGRVFHGSEALPQCFLAHRIPAPEDPNDNDAYCQEDSEWYAWGNANEVFDDVDAVEEKYLGDSKWKKLSREGKKEALMQNCAGISFLMLSSAGEERFAKAHERALTAARRRGHNPQATCMQLAEVMVDAVLRVDAPYPPHGIVTKDHNVWEELCCHAILMPTVRTNDETYQLWALGDGEGGGQWLQCPLYAGAGGGEDKSGEGGGEGGEGEGEGADVVRRGPQPKPPPRLEPPGDSKASEDSYKAADGGEASDDPLAYKATGICNTVVRAAVRVLYHLAQTVVEEGNVGRAAEALFFADALAEREEDFIFGDDVEADDGRQDGDGGEEFDEMLWYAFLSFPPLLRLLEEAIALRSTEGYAKKGLDDLAGMGTLYSLVADYVDSAEDSDDELQT
eukprot:m.107746 g.107746  ORF g.107746 m.107746 type:complete len:408 (+) comp10633_c0_seq2:207-1430(+)